jgi:hypothetical protein
LLNPSNQNLKIAEEKQRGVYVTSLTEEVVTCRNDVIKVIEKGEGKNREQHFGRSVLNVVNI